MLNEVAHSIFYAPMYVAIEEGYFAEEGIDLTLVTGFGADKTMTAVLSGEADIGFMGPESTIYTYLGETDDPVINFAQLTQQQWNQSRCSGRSSDLLPGQYRFSSECIQRPFRAYRLRVRQEQSFLSDPARKSRCHPLQP